MQMYPCINDQTDYGIAIQGVLGAGANVVQPASLWCPSTCNLGHRLSLCPAP
eukprot:SAG22_NODE_134_length_18372_cov_33.054944_5_plen_52_part_00